jgi:hypothetical protein
MTNLFGNYGPQEEGNGPPGPGGQDPSRWMQWLQLGLTSALVVLFVNQVMAFQEVNRKIARLHERMDVLESSRMLERRPEVEPNQRTVEQRLRQLETTLRELASDNQPAPASEKEIPAFQLPPPPSLMP